jgi:3-deoxy-7-phosphoheptulonate synthase
LSVTKQGLAAIVSTRGNQHCHVILRGGRTGPNYSAEAIAEACQALGKASLRPALMVDCSHANSQKDHKNQVRVAESLAAQVSAGSQAIFGVMLESNLVEGRQDVLPGKPLTHGQSITDACLGFAETASALERLAAAVRDRRKRSG